VRLIDVVWDAYCAGFLDGEGCFSYKRIVCTNTYPVVLFILQELYKGNVRKRKENIVGERPQYEWAVHGEAAELCLTQVIPFLIEKKKQAELVLEMCRYPKGSAQFSKMEKELREAKRIRYD
jgi:hypothetical protein